MHHNTLAQVATKAAVQLVEPVPIRTSAHNSSTPHPLHPAAPHTLHSATPHTLHSPFSIVPSLGSRLDRWRGTFWKGAYCTEHLEEGQREAPRVGRRAGGKGWRASRQGGGGLVIAGLIELAA